MTRTLKQRLTLPLIGLMIGIILLIFGFFWVNQWLSQPIEVGSIDIDTQSALKLNVLEQISKKNGITEWALKASSATLLKDQDKAILKDVVITFFTREKTEVRLTSRDGVLNTQTHDMTFSGDVVVTHETYVLRTDQLHYRKKEHIIYTNDHVRLEKADSVIDADSMITRLNENETVLTGHVRGTFSENFDVN